MVVRPGSGAVSRCCRRTRPLGCTRRCRPRWPTRRRRRTGPTGLGFTDWTTRPRVSVPGGAPGGGGRLRHGGQQRPNGRFAYAPASDVVHTELRVTPGDVRPLTHGRPWIE